MQQGGPQYGVPSAQPEMNTYGGRGGNASRGNLTNYPIPPAADSLQQHQRQHQAEVVSPISSRPPNFDELAAAASAGAAFAPDDAAADDADRGGGGSGGVPGNRWPRHETLALIKIRTDMDAVFRDATLKAPLWEEVSRKLSDQGYTRSAKKCKEKFENVHKYYKRTKEGRAGRHDGKNYRFFSQLEALHGTAGVVIGGNPASPSTPTPVSSAPLVLPPALNMASTPPAANIIPTTTTTSALTPPVVNFQPPSPAPLSSIPPPLPPPVSQLPPAPVAVPGLPSFSDNSNSSTPSSSGSDGEETEHEEGLGAGPESLAHGADRKRKRSSSVGGGRSKTMAFFSEMMRKLMQQQEAMQQRFLETIERREQERMAREEAWRRQEMNRVAREHEMAAQDRVVAASRDAAIISFLQKISGQGVPPSTPQPAQPQHAVAVVTAAPPPPQPPPAPTVVSAPAPAPQPPPQQQSPATPTPKPIPAVVTPPPPVATPQPQAQPQQHNAPEMPLAREHPQQQPPHSQPQPQPQSQPQPQPQAQQQHLDLVGIVAAAMSGGNADPSTPAGASSSRWPKSEVHALIQLRTGLESKYQDAGPKGPLWEEISTELRKRGYNRSAKRCKEKWENINKYFKKVKESNKKRPEDAKTCPYFHQLDELYRRKSQGSGGGGGSSGGVPNSQPLPITSAPPPPLQQLYSSDPEGNSNGGNNGNNRNVDAPPTRTSNGGMPSTFLGSPTGSGVLKKPEDMIIKELMMEQQHHRHRQPPRASDYDMMDTQDSENMDDDDYDDEDDEDDDDDDEQKTAFKIEFQRPNAPGGNAVSNGSAQPGGSSNPSSAATTAAGPFLAMVQ